MADGDPTDGPVMLFDGECVLCDRSVRFVAARDPMRAIRFAAIGSPAGHRLLADHGLAEDPPDSVVLVVDGRAFIRSDAVLRAAGRLRPPWRWGRWLLAVPRPVRDGIYRLIARRRYRWFGRRGPDVCGLPPRGVADRVLPGGLHVADRHGAG